MRKTWCALCVAGLLCCSAGRLWSGEGDAALRKLIARAIEAQGGEAKLAKFNASYRKGSGKFYGLGEGADITLELTLQGAHQQRFAFEVMKIKVVKVVNGDKGWIKLGDQKAAAMSKEELAQEKAEMFGVWVTTLVPLKDKAFKFAPLGEVKVGDRAAIGVRVSHAGHRDVSLFFDKQNHLLLKSEMMVKNFNDDKEVIEERFYSDYKDVEGTKQAMKMSAKRDGKRFVEGEISEIQLKEKVDDSTFAAP
ncbi:MAG TPA: hypothetical protein VEL76_39170 [Gemmataceae bacterium]|nr:hypothetical protein [Gemmataceae bacterium]